MAESSNNNKRRDHVDNVWLYMESEKFVKFFRYLLSHQKFETVQTETTLKKIIPWKPRSTVKIKKSNVREHRRG